MRKLVYATILATIGDDVGNRIYQRNSTGVNAIPANPEKPFVIYGEGVTAPHQEVKETSDAENIPFQVYVYDDQGSFIRITQLLRKLEGGVKALAGVTSTSGARCLGVSWGGLSQDFPDPEYEANVRFASFVLTGSHHEEG